MKIFSKLKNVLYYVVLFGLLLQNSAFATLFTPTRAHAKIASVVINEIYAPTTSDWVELYNATTEQKNLNGWYLQDKTGNTKSLDGLLIDGNGYLSVDVGNKLDNSGDTVNLFDNSGGEPIDIYEYKDTDLTLNMTIGRYPDGLTPTNDLVPTRDAPNQLPDTSAPSSSIDNITQTYYSKDNLPNPIIGTAKDNIEISTVKVKIKKYDSVDKFWDESTKSWTTDSNTWNDASGTNDWSFTYDSSVFTDELTYDIKTKAVDSSDNWQKSATVKTVTIDNTAPAGGSFRIDWGKQVTSDKKVTLSFKYDDQSEINALKISNDNFATFEYKKPTDKLTDWMLTDGNGMKTVSVRYVDKAGNETQLPDQSIYYNDESSDITKEIVKKSTLPQQFTFDNGKVVVSIPSATKQTTLTFAKYSNNPEGATGFTPLGGFFDLTLENATNVTFPITLEIYYTQQDLENAGIKDESQIKGLYYYDFNKQTWAMYPNCEVHTENVNGYAGKIIVEVTHLTPMTLGADTTPPADPANFKGVGSDGSVKLTWDAIPDASKYEIKYRQATSFDSASTYSFMTVTENQTEITGLENNINYEFAVRAVDAAGNTSNWITVYAAPQTNDSNTTDQTTENQTSNLNGYYYNSISTTDSQDQTSVSEENNNQDEEEIITEGDVKSEEDTQGETQGARTAVTLGIIIIAIGAALGGYYGYQWWLGEGEVEEENIPKETKKAKKKNKKTNRRW